MLSADKIVHRIHAWLLTLLQYSTKYKSGFVLGFSLAATDSGPLYTSVFYCDKNIFCTLNLSVPGGFIL